ncbi:M28 family peptidase [Hymenobacter humi]
MSELYKTGWRPKRTLMYCAWDGEEPGLLGSTEWAETNAKQLQKNVVAYLNTDNSERGFLYAAGSHTLEKFFNQVGRDVIDPEKNMSINERRRAFDLVNGSPEAQKDARDRADLRIAALGAGSDYSPYIQHLGIPSMNVGFGGEGEGGEYHSIYDSFDHFTRFKDPNFAYGIVLAQTMGRAALRLANADVLPFEFQNFSNTVAKYGTEVKQLADNMRADTEKQTKLLAEKRYEAVADPTETLLPPKAHEAVPYLNFAPLENALVKLEQSAQAYAQARKANTALSNDRKKSSTSCSTTPSSSCSAPRASPPPLVQASDLRPRLLHRLRRENAARHPRSRGGAQVGRSRRADKAHGSRRRAFFSSSKPGGSRGIAGSSSISWANWKLS